MKIELDGLVWNKDLKLVEIAFGMKKLVVSTVVEDEKISSDDIIERIEAIKWEKKTKKGESERKVCFKRKDELVCQKQ